MEYTKQRIEDGYQIIDSEGVVIGKVVKVIHRKAGSYSMRRRVDRHGRGYTPNSKNGVRVKNDVFTWGIDGELGSYPTLTAAMDELIVRMVNHTT